jgi:hypothetical protein
MREAQKENGKEKERKKAQEVGGGGHSSQHLFIHTLIPHIFLSSHFPLHHWALPFLPFLPPFF